MSHDLSVLQYIIEHAAHNIKLKGTVHLQYIIKHAAHNIVLKGTVHFQYNRAYCTQYCT